MKTLPLYTRTKRSFYSNLWVVCLLPLIIVSMSFLSPSFASSLSSSLLRTERIEDIQTIIEQVPPDTWVFCDVDDVIQTGADHAFALDSSTDLSPGVKFLDAFKKEGNDPKRARLMGQWRLMRRPQLVHPMWPTLIQLCHQRHIPIYALTQIDSGPLGPIASAEQWRAEELKTLGVQFTRSFCDKDTMIVIANPSHEGAQRKVSSAGLDTSSVFYHGVFVCGAFSKGEVLRQIIRLTPMEKRPKCIIFIDDRRSHVEDILRTCNALSIKCRAIHFLGIYHTKRIAIPEHKKAAIFERQKQLFLEGQWKDDQSILKDLEL